MIIHNVGYHHKHDSDFKIERPSGTGNFLFLLVKTDAIFFSAWTRYFCVQKFCIYLSRWRSAVLQSSSKRDV